MFTPLSMKHISIQVITSDLPSASVILAALNNFSPDTRPYAAQALPEVPGRRFRETYTQAKTRLDKIASEVGFTPTSLPKGVTPISESELDQANQWLGIAWETCSGFEETRRRQHEERVNIDQLETTLANFRNLHIDLGQLQGDKHFLETHIGMLPRAQVDQLRDALGLDRYLLFPFMESENEAHVIIVGANDREASKLQSVLDTAGFRPLEIPSELQAEPDAAKTRLMQRREAVKQAAQTLEQAISAWSAESRQELERAAQILHLAAPYVALGEAARHRGDLSRLQGWVPADDLPAVERALSERLPSAFVLEARDPTAEERPLVPSVMRHSPLLKPFSALVMQYGVPRYGEVNPTQLFALTYILMFGMMFGDVGHGAVILGAALLLHRKLGSFTAFGIAAGLSSMLFGFLYGSIFGFEHILHALWIAPLTDPLYMLTVALLWGIGFITLVTLLNIFNHLVQGDRLGALFGDNGLLSLLLYAGLLGTGYSFYADGSVGAFWATLAVLTLIGIFAHKLIEQEASIGERILVAFIETFETITGYASNTLSFLRVAAFSLNHVALAIAVFTLANMMGDTGHWITVVLGNVFILVLEGLIVAIQVLRLEFYEGFSRFYSGDGRAFKPLTL
ncbi:MAG: V-type ATP synthase subunit I [Candidatus Thiodiazotropha sp. (ex Dulcina madagascariensis)]|nr:V-type ATP synthase subunit I [Candidatus Thiodiazotropha sp. (ex Dulcina madagascariensis)]MCU7928756.1 V-type ATP synthase subunit I [Candidatus Thiodiazotropha sp. (ex Dulcina madagascariensis)]